MQLNSNKESAPRGVLARRLTVATVLIGALLGGYAAGPLLLGGASPDERQAIEEDWASLVAAAGSGTEEGGPEWEGSALQRAMQASESGGADAFYEALADGASCPPFLGGASEMVGGWARLSAGLGERPLDQVVGLLTWTRRTQRGAPNLVTLLWATVVADSGLEAAGDLEGGSAALSEIGPPDAAELFSAFCREQVALHEELKTTVARDADGDDLELMLLGLKMAGLHEARRLQGLLGDGEAVSSRSAWETSEAIPVDAPGRWAVWRALWLLRPEELAEAIFVPLLSTSLEDGARSWRAHLGQWQAAISGR